MTIPFYDPGEFVESLLAQVTQFCAPALPTDDMTLLLVMKKSTP